MKKQIIALAATTVIGGGLFGTAASAQTYTVQSGDTLWGISQKNNTTVQQVKSWNNLSSDLIFPNQKLEVGGSSSGTASAATTSSNGTYTVQPGDTLFKIASKHGLSVQSLKAINGLSSDRIYAGDKLSLSGSVKGVSTSRPAQAQAQEAPAAPAPAQQEQPAQQAPQGKTLSVTATAYTAECSGCSGVTATGINLNADRNAKVIAVDPNVIPLGSKVYVEGYGTAVAGDTGGAIKGNRIDLHVPTESQARDWGRRTVNITILN
ncbi:LysM peptidoglycan-binding and 3D domain-containing protein [Bacillus badius]|uniref:Cell wall-binding protein n=1 Tax=Bacillus badius TaxID=1455 RepID=A0ABR5AWA4_BACBA|nr:3D domain-containing protein [Bacillus badius]KIL76397.1 Cell wall-binding protein [Bacillus badius]KIL78513.1 Cell wall-binding protein [Bacillus badius]KZR58712.1 peptidoglycan-binding protein [Bacillus badius]MED4717431.1 LysM peptidoglycan-binding domain-containing protein [Bacillus badius]